MNIGYEDEVIASDNPREILQTIEHLESQIIKHANSLSVYRCRKACDDLINYYGSLYIDKEGDDQ